MEALDGNSIAGAMYEYFGVEMTTAGGTCLHCGAASRVAELRVYDRAPGTVVRCCSCGNVVIVLTGIGRPLEVTLSGFRLDQDVGQTTGAGGATGS